MVNELWCGLLRAGWPQSSTELNLCAASHLNPLFHFWYHCVWVLCFLWTHEARDGHVTATHVQCMFKQHLWDCRLFSAPPSHPPRWWDGDKIMKTVWLDVKIQEARGKIRNGLQCRMSHQTLSLWQEEKMHQLRYKNIWMITFLTWILQISIDNWCVWPIRWPAVKCVRHLFYWYILLFVSNDIYWSYWVCCCSS